MYNFFFFFLNCRFKGQRTIVNIVINSVVFKKSCCASLEPLLVPSCVFLSGVWQGLDPSQGQGAGSRAV